MTATKKISSWKLNWEKDTYYKDIAPKQQIAILIHSPWMKRRYTSYQLVYKNRYERSFRSLVAAKKAGDVLGRRILSLIAIRKLSSTKL